MKRQPFTSSTKRWLAVVAATIVGLASSRAGATVIDFADLTLSAESQWYGTDTTHASSYSTSVGDNNTFTSRSATFNNYHNWYYSSYSSQDEHYWESWAYSNRTDVATTGVAGQYTAMSSAGGHGDSNYGVAFCGWYTTPTVTFATPTVVSGAWFTNTAYVYDVLCNGDENNFSTPFGTGSQVDGTFVLTITGYNGAGAATGTVEIYLADYRGDSTTILRDWTWTDLSSLGEVSSLTFELSSSDWGEFGINTPTYFAMDDLTIVPEPSTLALATVALVAMGWYRRKRTAV